MQLSSSAAAKREQQRGLPSRPVARKLQLLASGAQRGAVWVLEQAHLVGGLADAVQAARLQLEPSANLTVGTIRQASGAAWGGVAAFFQLALHQQRQIKAVTCSRHGPLGGQQLSGPCSASMQQWP